MTLSQGVFLLSLVISAPMAMAAPDVTVAVTSDSFVTVYDATTYTVVVRNIGNKTAKNVGVVIELPETHTSPTVHVLGDLGVVDSRCSQAGTELTCTLGKIGKNKNKSFEFDIYLPQSADFITTEATVFTSSSENSTANNHDNDVATQSFYTVPVLAQDPAHVRGCTGTDLIAFFECELYPSSIIEHDIVFNGDGTLTIVGQPDYTGVWQQQAADHLSFSYSTNGTVVVNFEGDGVDGDCFEGLTTFPSTTQYVSPYEVCLQ